MFKYVADISDLAHHIIKNFLNKKIVAIDATLGNGHDTDFLSEHFDQVYSFDIQSVSCDNYRNKSKENVTVICDSHTQFQKYINNQVDCIIYNLGFLPGGNKKITTLHNTTLESISVGLNILNHGGIMAICIYKGHNEGKLEETCILEYLERLNKCDYGVMTHTYLNRSKTSPSLIIIEKK